MGRGQGSHNNVLSVLGKILQHLPVPGGSAGELERDVLQGHIGQGVMD